MEGGGATHTNTNIHEQIFSSGCLCTRLPVHQVACPPGCLCIRLPVQLPVHQVASSAYRIVNPYLDRILNHVHCPPNDGRVLVRPVHLPQASHRLKKGIPRTPIKEKKRGSGKRELSNLQNVILLCGGKGRAGKLHTRSQMSTRRRIERKHERGEMGRRRGRQRSPRVGR